LYQREIQGNKDDMVSQEGGCCDARYVLDHHLISYEVM